MSDTAAFDRPFTPNYATPPGATLAEWLEEQGMTQAELATRIEMSAKAVNQMLHGIAPLSQETALRLERVTGIPARTWNALEAYYQEHRARLETRAELEAQADWLEELPVADLRRLGVVTTPARDKAGQIAELLSFFAVASASAWHRLWSTTDYTRSPAFAACPGAMAAWLRLGEISAARLATSSFDGAALRAALPSLRDLTREPDPAAFVPRMVEICANAGVVVVLGPEIAGARCSGASRWIAGRPVVQLSSRHRSDDELWLTLFHQLGHVALHGRRAVFVDDGHPGSSEIAAKEAEADRYASESLIPARFAEEMAALTSTTAISAFAERVGVAPGVVVGLLQRSHVIGPRVGNSLKRRFHLTVAPTP